MNEYEKKFVKETAEPQLNEYRNKLMMKILVNEEKLKNQIINALENIAKKAVNCEDYKVKYIDFSLLQIEFLKEKYEITAIAYDKSRYLNEGLWEIFSVDYIFEELKVIKEKLYKDIKKYVGNIRPVSIDNYILNELKTYNIYFSYFFIKLLKQWDEDESYDLMPKAETLQITFGEYKNNLIRVYYYDNCSKDEKMFKDKLQNGKSNELVFSNWTGIEAENVIIENNDLSCMNLKESKLKKIYISSSMAVGLNFKKSNLKKCFFRNCDLKTSDFSESYLEEVVFENCILKNINFKNAKFKDVYLSNGEEMRKIVKKEDLAHQVC